MNCLSNIKSTLHRHCSARLIKIVKQQSIIIILIIGVQWFSVQ